MYETGKNRGLRGERYLVLVQVTTAEPVSYAKSRPCFERGMARDAVASATRDAGDIRCEVGIAPVFSWSPVAVMPCSRNSAAADAMIRSRVFAASCLDFLIV